MVEQLRVDKLAVKIISSTHPYADLKKDWVDGLPTSAQTPLLDLVTEAHQSLQLLSGIAVLATHRDAGSLQPLFDDTERKYFEVIEQLAAGPGDELTEALVDQLQRHAQVVRSEVSRASKKLNIERSLAESVGSILGPEPSTQVLEVVEMTFLALQADLNRGVALETLAIPSS